ncbi:MAG: lasso peptide biosynthesis B2 protein [Bacteroidetes bacterium]|nr:lasso peptide biosynthesis B2 protein [Bacteroidota bacterium]
MKGRHLRIFLEKPFSVKLHLLKIACYLAWYRFFILTFPFKHLSKQLGQLNATSGHIYNLPDNEIQRLAKSIRNVSQVVPWESKCLVQAVVAKVLLKKRETDSTLYFGVRKKDDGSSLEAHAWLDVNNEIVLGKELADQFTVVSSYT